VADPRVVGLAVCVLLACAAAGCAASRGGGDPAPKGARPEDDAGATIAFQAGRAGTFHSARFELSLDLPDGKAWRVDDHRAPWLVATHEPTRSTLKLRSWTEDRVVTKRGCYERARQWQQGLPDIDGPGAIGDEVRQLDATVEARLVSGVSVPDGSPDIAGFSVAVGTAVRKCVVIVYETKASRPAGPEAVADRLAVVFETVMAKVRFDRTLNPLRDVPARP
jgi:hypothetical protein